MMTELIGLYFTGVTVVGVVGLLLYVIAASHKDKKEAARMVVLSALWPVVVLGALVVLIRSAEIKELWNDVKR